MVTNVTSFGRSGLSDFVLQRVTAVILALYTLCVVGYFLTADVLSHETVTAFFGGSLMKAFSTMADYIRPHYFGGVATTARFIYQAGCILLLFFYTVWALQIFWSL